MSEERILFIEKLKKVKHYPFSKYNNDKLIILWASEIFDFVKRYIKQDGAKRYNRGGFISGQKG